MVKKHAWVHMLTNVNRWPDTLQYHIVKKSVEIYSTAHI